MKKKVNVLILDDIEIVAENITKRIERASLINLPFTNLQVVPHYLKIDHNDEKKAAQDIALTITGHKIDVLLLDRGFYNVVELKEGNNYGSLNETKLYGIMGDKGKMIETILKETPPHTFDDISGVVVYTYIPDDNVYEASEIKEKIAQLLPEKFDEDAIEVVQTNLEIYNLAKLKLYNVQDVPEHPDLQSWGDKSGFVLYGLFMGEILYHRVISIIKFKKYGKIFLDKKARMQRNIFFLFFIFTGLNIGATVLCELLAKPMTYIGLLILAIVFALGLPLLILWLKPELIINVDD